MNLNISICSFKSNIFLQESILNSNNFFRKQVTDMNRMVNGSNVNAGNKKAQLNDKDILDFYNLATGRLLTGLEVSIQFVLLKYLIDEFIHGFTIFDQNVCISISERSW